jgi:hypothetical protein
LVQKLANGYHQYETELVFQIPKPAVMKANIKFFTPVIVSLLLSVPVMGQTAEAIQEPNPYNTSNTTQSAEYKRAQGLIKRLDEINRIDKSKLTSAERVKLRKEVRTINKSLKEISGGVYLSVGAIIIIILLLILLL